MTSRSDRGSDGRLYFDREQALLWNSLWSAADRMDAQRFLDWLEVAHGELRYYDTPGATAVSVQAVDQAGRPRIVGELNPGYLKANVDTPEWFVSKSFDSGVFTYLELSNSQVGRAGGPRVNREGRDHPVCPRCYLTHPEGDCA